MEKGCDSLLEWRCANSECISSFEYCDNVANCYDGTDEVYCPAQGDGRPPPPPLACLLTNTYSLHLSLSLFLFSINPRLFGFIIFFSFHINLIARAYSVRCALLLAAWMLHFKLTVCHPATKFQCATDGRCLEKWRRCDGNFDCADQSDEIGCPGGFFRYCRACPTVY